MGYVKKNSYKHIRSLPYGSIKADYRGLSADRREPTDNKSEREVEPRTALDATVLD